MLRADKYFTKAKRLYGQKKFVEALKNIDKALTIDSTKTELIFWKGSVFIELGRLHEALACLEGYLRIKPDDHIAWNNKGYILQDLDEHESALKCFERANAVEPKYKRSWNNKGFSLNQMGRYEEALEVLQKALTIDPEYAHSWSHYGYALFHIGKSTEGMKCLEKALQIIPEYATGWYNKGYVLVESGDHKHAVSCFSKALQFEPRHMLTTLGVINETKFRLEFCTLLASQEFTDLELVTCGSSFNLHKAIVLARMPKLLQKKDWSSEFSPLTLEYLVRYIYCDDYPKQENLEISNVLSLIVWCIHNV